MAVVLAQQKRCGGEGRQFAAVRIENVTTMRYFLIPLFRPGKLQSMHFIERESQEI